MAIKNFFKIKNQKFFVYVVSMKYYLTSVLSFNFIMLMITPIYSETTDQNNSTNNEAIQEVMNGIRTEANAAWWGFDESDSTSALQSAIRSKAREIIVPNMGKPWIVEPIILESDKKVVFEKGVVIEAKPGAFLGKGSALFTAVNKKNITLEGHNAEFLMHKEDYIKPPYEKSEWRHCILIQGCKNIRIYGLSLIKSGGDGIYIGRGIGKDSMPNSDDIYIKDVTCDQNYRQGISISSASRLTIEDCTFRGTEGTSPQAGIDFEPNSPDDLLAICKVRNCAISYNSGCGIQIYLPSLNKNSKSITIEIEGCKITGNKLWPIAITGKNPKTKMGEASGSIKIQNCNMDGKVELQDVQMLDIKY
jgi:hypothetical protein